MNKTRTFGHKLALGFTLLTMLSICSSLISTFALTSVVTAKDEVIQKNARNLIDAGKLETSIHEKVTGVRGFLLTKDTDFMPVIEVARSNFHQTLKRLHSRAEKKETSELLNDMNRLEEAHHQAVEKVMVLRRTNAPVEQAIRLFQQISVPAQKNLDRAVSSYVLLEEKILQQKMLAAGKRATWTINLMIAIVLIVIVAAFIASFWLIRNLNHQINEAVQKILSSSSELQSAATQQSSTSQEQSSAMSEISTTIHELLTTSRLIAESARRVSTIAEETALSAGGGSNSVTTTQTALSTIKKQVDEIVQHMLELGRKSQRIGGILDIVNELSEQTNILALNATIEAVGAGEAGKRFGVVAEEIRKLADRVGTSTKEIRSLIEEMRSSVNTTVMATESGLKSVEAGNQHFFELARAFRDIAERVEATHNAAQEIELSTKQQATSVEQVNVAIQNSVQAAQETEVGAQQMLQTVIELNTLSRELTRMIRPTDASV